MAGGEGVGAGHERGGGAGREDEGEGALDVNANV